VIKDRRDGRAIQRSFETGSITEVLRRRTVVDVLRRAVGTPSQLERGELSVSLEATRCTESLFHQCSEPPLSARDFPASEVMTEQLIDRGSGGHHMREPDKGQAWLDRLMRIEPRPGSTSGMLRLGLKHAMIPG
jgi:hypothetical protein